MNTDLLIVTNLPSFYKINLYNRIAEHRKIFVIFTGDTAGNRKSDFFNETTNFEYINIQNKSFLGRIVAVLSILRMARYSEIIISGYNEFVYWVCAFLSRKDKNSTVVESSYLESKLSGIKLWLKKLFFSRISKVYASGISQEKLARIAGFDGEVVITNGVGIFNYIPQPPYQPCKKVNQFLYVGRLSPEKNLSLLLDVFASLPSLTLNIVGYGPMESELKQRATSNVHFLGAINNRDLPEIYQRNQVFVLPSKSEPWGLVIEEALNNGLPIIVSNRVGCAEQIINDRNGLIFSYHSESELKASIMKMCQVEFYNHLKMNISKLDFESIENAQVECYL